MEMGQIYFWTATINKWQRLLEKDEYKYVIINSLNHLSKKREDIWIDWNWMSGMGEIKDYDAHYNCEDKE